jgi:membrane protein implicated in regulation of membrane protease activity
MKWRLIIAVITTLLDEAIIIVLILWGLPRLGIHLSIPALVVIGVLWIGFAILLYLSGSKVLRKKPLSGLTDLIGFKGTAVTSISPKGMVRVNGELWQAISMEGNIQEGENIIIEKQDRLKLIVRKV